MKKIKMILAGTLVFAMLFGLAACGRPSNTGADAERITVRLAAPQHPFVENFDTNLYKLWLEEQTGLNIEITWLSAEDAERIVRLGLATGEGLPDAFVGFGQFDLFNNYNLQRFGEMGAIIPLNDLIARYGVHLQSAWDELAGLNLESLMTMPNGNIYYMPSFGSSLIRRYIHNLMWVNQGWLDALGLDVPTTTEEFRNMLYAFKTGDPNGNGIADEIPLAGTEEFYSKHVYDFLFNAFIYNDARHDRLLLENGVVGFAPIRDEWREALKFMRGLYVDGLMSTFSFTQSNQQHIQMANDPRDILGAFASPGITFTAMQNSPEVMARYVGIGPLMGPDGARYSTVNISRPRPQGVITSASQHPVEVFKLFDLMLSEYASLFGRYGEPGVDWEFAAEGDISVLGTPATVRIINQLWNVPNNKHLHQIVPHILRPGYSCDSIWDFAETDGEYMNIQAVLLHQGHGPAETVGPLDLTGEEEERVLHIRTDIAAYVTQSIIQFITGQRDIYSNNAWTAYVSEFERLGLAVLLETAQAVVDRRN
ncbi:MAG: extracellular solute-binding protein [Defluviitaleaceae bacterium]|nr:extracellular solute-binding protein [Defluviitaleaceae bacterium]